MKTELVTISPVKKEVKIEIEAEAIKKVYSQVVARYARLATVPGFRRGNAPLSIVKNRFKDDIQGEVLREVLPANITAALQEYDLRPLVEPALNIEGEDKELKLDGSKDLKLSVQVEVYPEIETPNYKGLEAVRRVRPLPEGEVDEVIEGLRKEQAFLAPVEDRKAEVGDTVTVNIHGEFVADHTEEPIVIDDLEIELGAPNVEPAFTENLIGTEADDVKTFIVEYPADFPSEGLAGKAVEYTATVQSVGKMMLPDLDEDFVQTLGDEEVKTIEQLHAKVLKDLETMAKLEADNRVRDDLVGVLVKNHPIEVPVSLQNAQAVDLVNNFANQMAQRGLNPKQADKRLWEMVYERMLPQAENEVRGAMLLAAVADAENIEISDDEINQEINNMAMYLRRSAEEIRRQITDKDGGMTNLIERMRNRRAVEIIFENAVITDGEWIEPKTEETETEETAEEVSENTEPSATEKNEKAEAAEKQ